MQVSVEKTSDLERKVTVGVPAEEVEGAVKERLEEARKNLRLDGFRPGKVPMQEVRRRYGTAVRQEVMGEVMRNNFIKAMEEESLQPAGMPQFETTKNQPGEDLEFTATFEVYPQVELADLSQVQLERPVSEVTEADIDEMIETLRNQRAEWQVVEGPAQNDDRVNIDYEGTVNGEAFEGGSAQGQSLVLGSGQMVPGFEEGIEGMSAGDEKDIEVTFPEEYHEESLAGQPAKFHVKVHQVERKALPEVDAEFMQAFGVESGDMDEFRTEVRKNMERELRNQIKNKEKEQVMDGLVQLHDFELPQALIKQEVERMRNQMVQQFGGGQQFDSSMLPDELFQDQAERSVRIGLIMRSVIDQYELQADSDRVKEYVEELASQYEQPQEVVNYVYSNQQQLEQVEGAVLEEQLVDLVKDKAQVTEKEMSYQEAVQPTEQQQGG
jgi:trigger factor